MRFAALSQPLLALSLLAAPAFAQDATPPESWLGETPHFVLVGTVAGRPVNFVFADIAASADVAGFAGKREYLPGDAATWLYGDFEVSLQAVVDGIEKSIELEFENMDFGSQTLPATFELTDVNFPEGLKTFVEIETEWETTTETVNDEVTGWTGTLTVSVDQGTPDAEGLVPDGIIGGYLVADSGDDHLVASFTVPVAEYEKDE